MALVLTHDVEGQRGVDRVKQLAEVEMELGFRSSFNFVPEGGYETPLQLREWLVDNDFEVGVHGLKHDGKLYNSRAAFNERAQRINKYMKDWQAAGFRSPLMHHNLEWLHEIDAEYDASTFDTDPFEPQPDGCDTIFPFWVGKKSADHSAGYVELPYTLTQDSTLFVLLQERSPAIWNEKVDWIVKQNGMALVNVHPDYIQFEGETERIDSFPLDYYREFLQRTKATYEGRFWHALPKDVTAHFRTTQKGIAGASRSLNSAGKEQKKKVWIDLDNTPHVPLFEPIIEELESRGFQVVLTARDAFQVCQLAEKKGLKYIKIGKHTGKNFFLKVVGLASRTCQLLPLIARERPILGMSHGARAQMLVSNLLRMPSLLMEDYEHAQFSGIMRPTWQLLPEALRDQMELGHKDSQDYFPGIKEDIYAWRLRPDETLLNDLGIYRNEIVVTVRPPATEAHYHNPESEGLFERFMDKASERNGVRIILLPRNPKQEAMIRGRWPQWFENEKAVVPENAVDGMNLIWNSDLVVSGGGTMNREAAALGVPVYSIFRGTIGAVDRQLAAEGRLDLIESPEEVDVRIQLCKRERQSIDRSESKQTLRAVVDSIVGFAEQAMKLKSVSG